MNSNQIISASFFENNLSVNQIHLSDEDLHVLIEYHTSLCTKLELKETDPNKLNHIMNEIIKIDYVHQYNILSVTKKFINVYYTVRKKLSYSISDQEILDSIIKEYTSLSGIGIESLYVRVCEYWKIRN